ncbi:hypothetical protein ACHAXN_004395 [Cyclotella atomus]
MVRDRRIELLLLIAAALLCSSCLGFSSAPLIQQQHPTTETPINDDIDPWSSAKLSLRHPTCCIVSVSGLDPHLSILQQYFCGLDSPLDLDLRARIRCGDDGTAYRDCFNIYTSIMNPSPLKSHVDEFDDVSTNIDTEHPCVLALQALAKGVASLSDGPLQNACTDVHMRIVFASNYKARDPMFHTDKCPLRGYVTLTGPGTEYMKRTCRPWEYVALRTLGAGDASNGIEGLEMAKNLEFIVMKGDTYDAPLPEDSLSSPSILQSMLKLVWTRDAACVHRSPPVREGRGERRVILSLDLADGVDDQEWYEYDKKRGWRSGMTQRKSHLVA